MSCKSPEDLRSLIESRFSRRRLLAAGSGLAAVGLLPACASDGAVAAPAFTAITPSGADTVAVPAGYRSDVVIRWGDALFSDAPVFDAAAVERGGLASAAAAQAQGRQFGSNCDGLGVFETEDGRTVLCVNHEYASAALMFPGWRAAARERRLGDFVAASPQCVAFMQAAVGLSVVELQRVDGIWQPVVDSQFNRRVTASTPMTITGPASAHPLLADSGTDSDGRSAETPVGTFGNCAAGTTPWGTYLTAEENVQDYFGNGDNADFDDKARAFHERFGYRRRGSTYGWEHADSRFDLSERPNEPFRFGWVVEVDPLDPQDVPRKLTALGRLRHEGATTVVAPDGRVVVYMGDDEAFEYFYKFVSRGTYDPNDRAANRSLLEDGTLYAAKLEADGTGSWLPLEWSQDGVLSPATGFDSQADVVINCRGAADLLQATPLDRPEDVAVDSRGRVYLACTMNPARGGPPRGAAAARGIDTAVDAANPRTENRGGHILEFVENDAAATARSFTWEVLIVAGATNAQTLVGLSDAPLASESVYFAGVTDAQGISSFANPDNLATDSSGNLWIVTDGTQPVGNNGCFACALDGPLRGVVKQFMEGPVGAEICGCEFTADERTLFLAVQHPGSGGTAESPISTWPDGPGNAPRSSLIAIEPIADAGEGVRVGQI